MRLHPEQDPTYHSQSNLSITLMYNLYSELQAFNKMTFNVHLAHEHESIFFNCHTIFQILSCSEMFPRLQTLHACFNDITSISDPEDHLQHLQLLNLESNPVTGWSHLLNVGKLPKQVQFMFLIILMYFPVSYSDLEFHSKSIILPKRFHLIF